MQTIIDQITANMIKDEVKEDLQKEEENKMKDNKEGFEFDFFYNNKRIYGLSKADDGFDNIYIDTDNSKLLLLKEAMLKAIDSIDLFIKK